MATLAQLKATLVALAAIEDTNRLGADLQREYLNMARRRLATLYEWSYFEAEDSLACTPGNEALALPATASKLYLAYYLNAGAETNLRFIKTREEFRRTYPKGTAAGTPAAYTFFGRNMILGPPPSTNLMIYREFYQVPADLSAEDQHDVFSDGAADAIVFTALADFVPIALIEDSRIATLKAQRDEIIRDKEIEQGRFRTMAGPSVMQAPG